MYPKNPNMREFLADASRNAAQPEVASRKVLFLRWATANTAVFAPTDRPQEPYRCFCTHVMPTGNPRECHRVTKRKSRPFTSRSCFGEISDGCSVVKDGFHVEQVCCVVKVSDIGCYAWHR